jgi:hypothetical protein
MLLVPQDVANLDVLLFGLYRLYVPHSIFHSKYTIGTYLILIVQYAHISGLSLSVGDNCS